ncbi:MAG: energy-coupling factor transporter transmembrane component T family protein [Planctomycetia bacterium]
MGLDHAAIHQTIQGTDALIGRMEPRTKILLGLAVAVVAGVAPAADPTPGSSTVPTALLMAATAVAVGFTVSGLSWKSTGRRFLRLTPFLLLLAVGAPASRYGFSAEHWLGGPAAGEAVVRFLRAATAAGAVYLVVQTTSPATLGSAAVALGAPRFFVLLVGLTVRYLYVLEDEWSRLHRARAARGVAPSAWLGPAGWKLLPDLVGLLFLRSLDRAERVHRAMLARGWSADADPGERPR